MLGAHCAHSQKNRVERRHDLLLHLRYGPCVSPRLCAAQRAEAGRKASVEAEDREEEQRKTQADVLLELASGATLFHTPERAASAGRHFGAGCGISITSRKSAAATPMR
jgi:hypothetical protein